jgi:PcfJ-like protein
MPALRTDGRASQARLRLDRGTRHCLGSLPTAESRAVFLDLCRVVRQRSVLLQPDSLPNTGAPQLELLRNLADACADFVRQPVNWSGCAGSANDAAASLILHLLARYPVPRVLHQVWSGGMDAAAHRARRWFLAHAAGRALRSLDLPLPLTRRMEHHFLGSPPHLSIPQALRRAELLALGAGPELVQAVIATRMGSDLTNPAVWRQVGQFLVRVQHAIDPLDVGVVVDFVHGVKLQFTEAEGPEGPVVLGPPCPDFELAARSLASVLRLARRWHATLALGSATTAPWSASRQAPMVLLRQAGRPATASEPAIDPLLWELIELRSPHELQQEGRAMQHCVGSYAIACRAGSARIWSLRSRRGHVVRPLATIEVRPADGAIVQVRGPNNTAPTRSCAAVIEQWARREGLVIAAPELRR